MRYTITNVEVQEDNWQKVCHPFSLFYFLISFPLVEIYPDLLLWLFRSLSSREWLLTKYSFRCFKWKTRMVDRP